MYSEIQNTTVKVDYYIQQNCLLKLKEMVKTFHVFMTTKAVLPKRMEEIILSQEVSK